MNLLETLKEAINSINANRTRSFLTILGIVIGVGAVIGLMGIGQGAQETITGQISSIGTNVVYVMSGNFMQNVRNARPITMNDAEALMNRTKAPSILRVAPVNMTAAEMQFEANSMTADVFGATAALAQVQSIALAEGEFINQTHLDSRAAVVVLGPDVAEKLFGRTTGLVGSSVRIKGTPYRVIGITVSKGGGQMSSPDRQVYLPLTTYQLRLGQSSDGRVQYIAVQAVDSKSVTDAIREANAIMRESHRLTNRQADDFTVTNQEDFLSIANSITSVLTVFLSGIAGISLLVGGIGIMNIMLVSVTERTREIGLRKALGARKSDIMLQFLSESALLSMIGGLLGIGLGWLLAAAVGAFAQQAGTVLNPTIEIQSILLATLFSTAVGVFFGLYPASKAANLEPVEALRYE
ncbi:MAG: ABC transporter permease [Anaerolineaceae bacterium]